MGVNSEIDILRNELSEALGYCGWLRGMVSGSDKMEAVRRDIEDFDMWYLSKTRIMKDD